MTTDTVELPESARRFHEMYRSDLSRVEPVSDAQILAAIDRAEAHNRNQIPDAAWWDEATHTPADLFELPQLWPAHH
jgi:hypothetical protein